jgi:putative SOS response-associated peptidase YedK
MYLAGLYDQCYPASNTTENGAPAEPLLSYTIVTVEASEAFAWLHDRMPVLLNTRPLHALISAVLIAL